MKTNQQQGFTLIEMAVVMVILSLAVAGGLSIFSKNADVTAARLTQKRLEKVSVMIDRYVNKYGYLPCPANALLAVSSAGFSTVSGGSGTCTNNENNGANVVQGALPVGALGLMPEYMLDGWGRQFTYVVHQTLTSAGSITAATDTTSSIQLQDAANVSVAKSGTNTAINPAYLLISHGRNGFGAMPAPAQVDYADFSVRVNDSRSASTSSRTMENDNHHMDDNPSGQSIDVTYRALPLREQAGSSPASVMTDQIFDDIVLWRSVTWLQNFNND